MFTFVPACKGNVASDVKTGKIDHRTVCGNQFSVKDGAVKEKAYVYICPACKGNVASDVKTRKLGRQKKPLMWPWDAGWLRMPGERARWTAQKTRWIWPSGSYIVCAGCP